MTHVYEQGAPHLGVCRFCCIGWTFPRDPAVRWPWPVFCPVCRSRLQRLEEHLWAGETRAKDDPPARPVEETRQRPGPKPKPPESRFRKPAREPYDPRPVLAGGPLTTRQFAERLGITLGCARGRLRGAEERGLVVHRKVAGYGQVRVWCVQCNDPPTRPAGGPGNGRG